MTARRVSICDELGTLPERLHEPNLEHVMLRKDTNPAGADADRICIHNPILNRRASQAAACFWLLLRWSQDARCPCNDCASVDASKFLP